MLSLIEVAKSKNLKRIEGEVLSTNYNMLKLMKNLGFKHEISNDDANIVKVTLLV
jgi:RimJ/RimL family protein N-acetyltransferase